MPFVVFRKRVMWQEPDESGKDMLWMFIRKKAWIVFLKGLENSWVIWGPGVNVVKEMPFKTINYYRGCNLNENYQSNNRHLLPHYTKWPHQICIINTAGREKWWVSVRATLAIFSNPSFSGTLLKGLAGPTLSQLSGYTQLRYNNPNSHSLQFPHLCLHTHLPYVHNRLWTCSFLCCGDQRPRSPHYRLKRMDLPMMDLIHLKVLEFILTTLSKIWWVLQYLSRNKWQRPEMSIWYIVRRSSHNVCMQL